MYIKIRVFCTKFVNKYYSNYFVATHMKIASISNHAIFFLVFHSFEFSIKILVNHG